MDTRIYWKNKEERSNVARNHFNTMKEYREETLESVQKSQLFTAEKIPVSLQLDDPSSSRIILRNKDTVSMLYEIDDEGKIALLNFASYKNPGGKFLDGSCAQEESLCHESNLYNILIHFMDDFYRPNLDRLHNALYESNLIYTPNVLFIRNDEPRYSDVITCAAPNSRAARQWFHVTKSECINAMFDRIDYVLYAAYSNNVENLILGAFGCGVFGNDITEVIVIFLLFLYRKYHGCFKHIYFSIPTLKENDVSFDIIKDIFINYSDKICKDRIIELADTVVPYILSSEDINIHEFMC